MWVEIEGAEASLIWNFLLEAPVKPFSAKGAVDYKVNKTPGHGHMSRTFIHSYVIRWFNRELSSLSKDKSKKKQKQYLSKL